MGLLRHFVPRNDERDVPRNDERDVPRNDSPICHCERSVAISEKSPLP
jgi:hypothetical protein